MTDFSVPDGGIPHYGIDDVVFPLAHAEAAYDAVTALLAAMDHGATGRNAAADRALVTWTGPYADYFRQAREQWLDGRQVRVELHALQARLLSALKTYQELQREVISQRRDVDAAGPTRTGSRPRYE